MQIKQQISWQSNRYYQYKHRKNL